MIVDLDAHQGNGYQRDLMDDPDIFIIDFYHHGIEPQDIPARKAIKRDIVLISDTTDKEYISKIYSIELDMENFKPDFVIYNAGTDILAGDPLGRVNISQKGVI